MTLRILVSGYKGKVGREIIQAVTHADDMELVGQVGKHDDLAVSIQKSSPDIVIDFTAPDAAVKNASIIIEAKKHPVIGTTGFTPEDIKSLKAQCNAQQLGGIIAPNFSIGAVLMMKYAQDAAHYLNSAEIIEYHHATKRDAPSGTAIKTAEMIRAGYDASSRHPVKSNSVEMQPGARGAHYHDISVHSVRLPGLVAHQTVIFGGLGETLTLRHDSISRESFIPGILLACRKVMSFQTLVYGLESLL